MSPPGPEDHPDGDVRGALRQALAAAMRARDTVAASALRSVLGAIDNAEAVPAPQPPASQVGSAHIAGARAGLGAGEAQRRGLGEAEARAILRAEIEERLAAAADYERAGHGERAARLRREAQALIPIS